MARVTLGAGMLLLLIFLSMRPSYVQAANQVTILQTDARGLTLEIRTADYTLKTIQYNGATYQLIEVDDYGALTEIGMPLLPARSIPLGVPEFGDLSIQILKAPFTVRRDISPAPVPDGLRSGPDGRVSRAYIWDEEFLRSSGFYPSELATIQRLGLMRDQPIAVVTVYPFRYNPASGELRIYERIVVRVNYPTGVVPAPLSGDLPLPTRRMVSTGPGEDPYETFLSHTLANYSTARSWRQKPNVRPKIGQNEPQPLVQYRIEVDSTGIYQITGHDLQAARIPLAEIDIRTLKLTNQGQDVPILVKGDQDGVFDPEDYFEFYGEGIKQTLQDRFIDMYQDPFTDINVYWLSWGGRPGARMARENVGIFETNPARYFRPRQYEYTVHREEDKVFDRLGGTLRYRDHWFWQNLAARTQRTYLVDLPGLTDRLGGPVRLRVMLHGRTFPPQSPDHHVQVWVNGLLRGDAFWDGLSLYLLDEVSAVVNVTNSPRGRTWFDSLNELTLNLPADTPAGSFDEVYLNWFEVEYPKLYRAIQDQIVFSKPKTGPPGLYLFSIDGFTKKEIDVYKVGVSKLTNTQISLDSLTYRVSFQDEVINPDTRYIALTPEHKRKPLRIKKKIFQEDLRSPDNRADYIIITHDYFFDRIQPLAQFREEQGWRTKVVKVSDIYDTFNHGIFNPQAIRDFLSYAYHNWTPPAPRFVLLVGDGSLNYKGGEKAGNFVPVYQYQSIKFGAIGSDHWYTLVSGDDNLADLFVGRLPVRTVTELDIILRKILSYEKEPNLGSWRKDLFFIGGQGLVFREQAEALITHYVPPQYDVSRLHVTPRLDLPVDPYYFFGAQATEALIQEVDRGAVLLDFMGHGGGGTWSDFNLFTFEDVPRLSNQGRLPVMVSMTCFTGAFEEFDGLGERFLKSDGKGAIAFFGSTGLGWLQNDFYMNQEFLDGLFKDSTRPIGQLFAEAKNRYLMKYGGALANSLVFQFTLLGDPLTRIGLPREEVTIQLNPLVVSAGDTLLEVAGEVPDQQRGTVKLIVLEQPDGDEQEAIMGPVQTPVEDGRFSVPLALPEDLTEGTKVVKAYFSDSTGQREAVGFGQFTRGEVLFANVYTEPALPGPADSVYVVAEVAHREGIVRLTCIWTTDQDHEIVMAPTEKPNHYRTTRPIPPHPLGTEVYYFVSLLSPQGTVVTSPLASYQIPLQTDLVAGGDLTLGGTEAVTLFVKVKNNGGVTASEVPVHLYLNHETPESLLSPPQVIPEIEPGTEAIVAFSLSLPPGLQRLIVQVDPEGRIPEQNKANNRLVREVSIDRFNVTPDGGTIVSDSTRFRVGTPDGNLTFTIPPGFVRSRTVAIAQPQDLPGPVQQPDIRPVPPPGRKQGQAFRIALTDSLTVTYEQPMRVELRYDTSDTTLTAEQRSRLGVYRWHPEIARWVFLGGTVESGVVTAESNQPGLFAVFLNQDQTPPRIKLSAESQPIVEGGFIKSDPVITAVVQDENGIDTVFRGIRVILDGTPLIDEQVTIPVQVRNANMVPVEVKPRLDPGAHTLRIEAWDCNGNPADSKVVQFQVDDDIDIRRIGNYPNPMRDDYTIFTYVLTNAADHFSLKIYTVSGRLVREFDSDTALEDLTSPGYHEIVWEGDDRENRLVANGVYFYRLQARMADRTVRQIGKLAVLR